MVLHCKGFPIDFPNPLNTWTTAKNWNMSGMQIGSQADYGPWYRCPWTPQCMWAGSCSWAGIRTCRAGLRPARSRSCRGWAVWSSSPTLHQVHLTWPGPTGCYSKIWSVVMAEAIRRNIESTSLATHKMSSAAIGQTDWQLLANLLLATTSWSAQRSSSRRNRLGKTVAWKRGVAVWSSLPPSIIGLFVTECGDGCDYQRCCKGRLHPVEVSVEHVLLSTRPRTPTIVQPSTGASFRSWQTMKRCQRGLKLVLSS